MHPIDKIREYENEVINLYRKINIAKNDIRNWAILNQKEIKKHFPVTGRIYEIIDIRRVRDNYIGIDLSKYSIDGDKYYLQVTYNVFNPRLYFRGYQIGIPTVKGVFYDTITNKKQDIVDMRDEFEVDILNLREYDNNIIDQNIKETFIYIMIYKNTGYYKIGRSKRPEYRERTLQSEKPTIEMLKIFKAKVYQENYLHKMFDHRRIRGEWFNLSGDEIQRIFKYFNHCENINNE